MIDYIYRIQSHSVIRLSKTYNILVITNYGPHINNKNKREIKHPSKLDWVNRLKDDQNIHSSCVIETDTVYDYNVAAWPATKDPNGNSYLMVQTSPIDEEIITEIQEEEEEEEEDEEEEEEEEVEQEIADPDEMQQESHRYEPEERKYDDDDE
jgi:hypothetical protein